MRAVLAALLLAACAAEYETGVRGGGPYNEAIAKKMVMLSAAAHEDNPQPCLDGPLQWPTLKVYNTYNASNNGFIIFGFSGVDDSQKSIVLSYRGTEGDLQLIVEILTANKPVTFTPAPSVQVSDYFFTCTNLVYASVKADMQRLIAAHPGYTVYITGHSLGASVSVVTATQLALDGVLNGASVVLYNFGLPRTGSYGFAHLVDSIFPTLYRVVHYQDLVPHFPPCCTDSAGHCINANSTASCLWWTYHVDTEVWYQETMPYALNGTAGSYQVCTGVPAGEDPACSNGVTGLSGSDHVTYFSMNVGDFCASNLRAPGLVHA